MDQIKNKIKKIYYKMSIDIALAIITCIISIVLYFYCPLWTCVLLACVSIGCLIDTYYLIGFLKGVRYGEVYSKKE